MIWVCPKFIWEWKQLLDKQVMISVWTHRHLLKRQCREKLLHGLSGWLLARVLRAEKLVLSSRVTVMQAGMEWLRSVQYCDRVWSQFSYTAGVFWELLSEEHVYPALLTWFISTSMQPIYELFTFHCDTEEKREEEWRGCWIWDEICHVRHRNKKVKKMLFQMRDTR